MECIRTILVAATALMSGGYLFADAIVWSGLGSDGKWTNPDNWVGRIVPGSADTAQFGSVEAGAKTTVDLQDAGAIGGIVIVDDDAPTYTFGTSTAEAQCTCFAAGGTGLSVGEDVVNAPTFKRIRVVEADSTEVTLTICNDGASALEIPQVLATTRASGSSVKVATTFDLRGSGDIRFTGSFPAIDGTATSDYGVLLNQNGKLLIGTQFGPSPSNRPPYTFKSGDVAAVSRIEVEEGCALITRTQYGKFFEVVDSDLEVSGKGMFGVAWYAGYDSNENRLKIASDRKLVVSCTYGGTDGVRFYHNPKQEGTLVFAGANTLTGPVQSFFGTMEARQTGGFGTGTMWLDGSGVLRYAGDMDWTTSQKVCLTNWPAAKTLEGTLEVTGGGLWTIAGDIAVCHNSAKNPATGVSSGALTLAGTGEGAVSGCIMDGDTDKNLKLIKSDAGVWKLAGANTYTGSTTLNEGTLEVLKTGSLACSSGVEIKGGTLSFEGDAEAVTAQSLKKITITGDGILSLSGKVTVTADEVSRTSGKVLNVVTKSPDAKLIVPVGTASGAFLWNGQPAVIGADGEVKLDADAVVAARGDVVPNNNGVVAIFYDGTTGNDQLAEDNTTLAKLIQMSDTAATVQIGAGRSLSVPSVVLGSDAADLMLGAAGDAGTLDSPTKTIAYDNASADSKIVINAALAVGVTNSLEKGTVVFKGDIALSRTTIATADKAKAQLEIRDCDVETGIEPLIIGNNTGTDYSGGGMQYGEVTVSNAVICNKADIERGSTKYGSQHEYGIVVGKNASGVLRVQEGSIVSNRLLIGIGGAELVSGRGSGAVYQSGGEVVAFSPIMAYGGNSMSYYELSGGTFKVPGTFSPGTSSYAMWDQSAGTTATVKNLNPSSGNGGKTELFIRGHMNVSDSGSRLCNGYQDGNISIFTVDGPDALLDLGGGGSYAFEASGKIQTVRFNVNDSGVLRVGLLYRNKVTSADSRFSVAFDGGIFACGASAEDVFSYQGQPLDSVRIHSKGMTVDTRGMGTGTGVALTAASGKGVTEIPFDWATFPQWNVPPFIRIDGDGDGATAHALFDSSSQCVTGVVITCSGSGYTTATATAVYVGNGCPSSQTVDCVLSDNVTTGSFTKTGTGTFTLNAENSWGGKTIAAGGTLKVGCDNAIPAGTSVLLAGGDIDFNDKVCSVANVTYGVGGGRLLKTGNVQLPSTFDMAITADEILSNQSVPLSGNQDLTGKTLIVTGDFSSLDPEVCRRYTVVSVTGGTISGEPTIVAPALPKGWSFVTRLNGVKLVNPLGMLMIVR